MIKKGRLEVVFGCMSCGKTEELIRRMIRAEIAKLKIVTFKSKKDTRSPKNKIVSRDGGELPAIDIEFAHEILETAEPFEVVGIDEVQFFDEGLIRVINILINQGKRVIISGLDTNFRGEPFKLMAHLIAIADERIPLFAVCMKCGRLDANRTQRIINDQPAPYNSPLEMVGGDEAEKERFGGVYYEARCRDCHQVPKGLS